MAGPLMNMYRDYQVSAEKKKVSFSLSFQEFEFFTEQNCYYCGSPPESRKRKWAFKASGIDRKDSDDGYVLANCVSSCRVCNFAKGTMSYSNFCTWISKVNDHLKKSGVL